MRGGRRVRSLHAVTGSRCVGRRVHDMGDGEPLAGLHDAHAAVGKAVDDGLTRHGVGNAQGPVERELRTHRHLLGREVQQQLLAVHRDDRGLEFRWLLCTGQRRGAEGQHGPRAKGAMRRCHASR